MEKLEGHTSLGRIQMGMMFFRDVLNQHKAIDLSFLQDVSLHIIPFGPDKKDIDSLCVTLRWSLPFHYLSILTCMSQEEVEP
jgi:hypothetical protein